MHKTRKRGYNSFYHMGKTYIIANWKSNKTAREAEEWFSLFKNAPIAEDKIVIICPPFTLLPITSTIAKEKQLQIAFGAQTISQFSAGSYTGEIYGAQIKEFGLYTIIGHSERRTLFHETNEQLSLKVANAFSSGLTPIFCVQDADTFIPEGVGLVAYEPVSAIGSGNPDTPENAQAVAATIKQKNPVVQDVLYGGSITAENVKSFTDQPDISGVLVGKASLDPLSFNMIIQNS